jgi:iron complex outermembrane receptor protein
MKRTKRFSTFLLSLLFAFTLVNAQEISTEISGKLVEPSGETVIGANIYIKGTTIGTVSSLDGSFKFSTTLSGEQTVVISSVGMATIEKTVTLSGQPKALGTIEMESDAVGLAEVMVFADVAIDRRTPVAVSNVKPEQIEAKLGAQEFPEVLKSTPGVYATKQGGAFGDARINIRGFDARYVAVMINGVPVNDMENNWVYWSNWAGLSEVTRSMQVQRGLGAAKVAIPSVGGTINILTKTTDAETGGTLYLGTGDNGYNKIGVTLSSGMTENNWATTFSLARSSGEGWVDGTQFESYSYFLNISKIINDQHRIAFTVFGAPQWHGQRSSKMFIDVYKESRINDTRYNSDWGYKNGQVYHISRNYYHKPKAILNHYWTVNDRLSVNTAAYVSVGTGGGSGPLGDPKFYPSVGTGDEANKYYNSEYRREGLADIDKIVDENIAAGPLGSETILRNSVNNHFWTGFLPQVKYKMDLVTISGGLDLRYYVGEHYREVDDLLGGEFFMDAGSNRNNPYNDAKVGDKVAYHNDGIVGWVGGFAQAEVVYGDLSGFVAGAISNKSYRRVDYFNYFDPDLKGQFTINDTLVSQYYNDLLASTGGTSAFENALELEQISDWYHFIGYSAKMGANYNFTEQQNAFFNIGYFTNPADFRTVFPNFTNVANDKAPNEKVFSVEAGYGFSNPWIAANINVYRTTWKDKARVLTLRGSDGVDFFANLTGIRALHQGIELDMKFRPIEGLDINLMGSVGDWRWTNDLENVPFFDNNQVKVDSASVYIKNIHVGDAAQTTAALGVNYELLKGFVIGVDYNYYDRLYAAFRPENRTSSPEDNGLNENPDSWLMPTYHIVDANIRYKFKIGDINATLIGNANNLFDVEHITDADDGPDHDWKTSQVYYGWGRSWRVALKVQF